MKFGRVAFLLLCILVVTTALAGADRRGRKGGRGRNKHRKGNRNGKKGLRWKKSSLPKDQTRFIALHEEEPLELDCKTSGKPKPTISWSKDGQMLEASEHVTLKKYDLNIKKVVEADTGNYTCDVSNGRDHLAWTFVVEVSKKIWPLKIVGPENITATVGSDAEFTCRVINDNTAFLSWKKMEDGDGNAIKDGIFMSSLPSDPGVLRLEKIRKEDAGVYTCIASNKWGSRPGHGNLTVIDLSDTSRGKDRAPGRSKEKTEMKNKQRKNNILESDPMVEKTIEAGSDVEADFGPDMGTTRRRGKGRKNNKGGRRNRNRGKNRKNKAKKKNKPATPFYFETFPTTALTTLMRMTVAKTTEIQVSYDSYKTTTPQIWDFGKKYDDSFDEGMRDTRYNHPPGETIDDERVSAEVETDKALKEGDAANAVGNEKNNTTKDGISAWTIYTVVGAVCGVILLIGLVAVTLTLCCKREEEGVYKSATPV